MRVNKGRIASSAVLLLAASAMALAVMLCASQPVWAVDRDVEWGRYQNSPENNGVTGVAMPASYEEASLKWGKQLVQGYTVSFTPPLIIDGYLYTASNKHVYRINKETGDILKESQELKLNVSYAMNPLTYDPDNDQLYVPILNGRVACLDMESLQVRWTSKEYKYTQSLSPITYKDGALYTGIWEAEDEDGVFFRLNAATGEEEWAFKPSEHGDLKHGFYWAGAYVNEKYVVVGSDDGSSNTFAEAGAFPNTAVVYCFDRETGEVVDRITGVKGDIRSTVVFHQGHIYFVSKGGCLYKASLSAEGKFSNVSSIQLKDTLGVKDAMMTSTPVVYGGRVYAGAAGSGGQFSADGGHMFAVIRDDATLGEDSLLYTTQIPGYPQAAPLLSTAEGKTRLYFTFNAFPGGIYCLEDAAGATRENHPEAQLIYRPELDSQQYCISPLCCDREGTIYFKNDSGNMMAVSVNKAWLDDISVQCDSKEVEWDTSFRSGTLRYNLKAPDNATSLDVRLTIPAGVTATVNGAPCTGKTTVAVAEDMAPVTVTARRTVGSREYVRTYTLNVSTQSNNANLAGMVINTSNTRPAIVDANGTTGSNTGVGYDPTFDPAITEYVGKTYDGTNRYLNIWLQAADPGASIRVIPTDNVGNTGAYINEDGTIPGLGNNKDRYPVYWVKGENSAEVDVEVTSESGKAARVYHVTLVRGKEHLDVGAAPLKVSPSSLTLYTRGKDRSAVLTATYNKEDVTARCTWESTDVSVATVDEDGNVFAAAAGEAEIWATCKDLDLRARTHVVVKQPQAEKPLASLASGTYTEDRTLTLMPATEGTIVRYNMGSPEEDVQAPETTTGTVYKDPIQLTAEPGQKVTYQIRAIACGGGYSKSGPELFEYVIDRTGEEPPAALKVAGVNADRTTDLEFANGTSAADIEAEIRRVGAVVTDDQGNSYNVDVDWDTEDLPYDPEDLSAVRFLVHGTASLPQGVEADGNTMQVSVAVSVAEGTVEAPVFDPATGTYRAPTQVTMKTGTKGAAIAYTVTGTAGTQIYSGPVSLEGEKGRKVAVVIRAYAVRSGVKSTTVSGTFTIDRLAEMPKPARPILKDAEVNAPGRKITLHLSKVAGASSYVAQYRQAGSSAWKTVKAGAHDVVISGLQSGGAYEVRGAAANAGGQSAYTGSSCCFIAKASLKVGAKKKALKVSSKKVKGASGYRYRASTSASMSGAKTVNAARPKATIKGLKSKSKYYVQAAPLIKKGGKTYVGQWTTTKKKVK